MTQGLKKLQDSHAYKKTGMALTAAKSKTASVWSSISGSQSFISASQRMGSAFGAAKSRVSASFSSQNLSSVSAASEEASQNATNGASEMADNQSLIQEEH